MTLDELTAYYRSLPDRWSQNAPVRLRSSLSDEEEVRSASACMCGACLCGHPPARRCPCGRWPRPWERNCVRCGRPGWCEG